MGNTRTDIFCDFFFFLVVGWGEKATCKSYLPLHHITKGIIFKTNVAISIKHLLHRQNILKTLSIFMVAMDVAY